MHVCTVKPQVASYSYSYEVNIQYNYGLHTNPESYPNHFDMILDVIFA